MRDALGRLHPLRRPGPALLVVTALALAARLYALGWRVMHQDEARVAGWILEFARTGAWEYRPIVHGPFLPHVNNVLFSAFGPSDFTARLVVALLGGLLPLAAWLLRDRLSDAEVVGVGVVLALNPALLYYSRFMRNDLPLAAVMVFAVAFAVRAIDTGRARHLYAATAALALGFTMKENALVYPVAWLGALALVFDHRLFLARTRDGDWLGEARAAVVRTARTAWAWKLPILACAVEFLAIVTVFYAPKPQLWTALANPAALPGVVEAATLGSWRSFADTWLNTEMQGHPYLPYLGSFLKDLALGAGPLAALAVLGFLYDRYGRAEPRAVVSFTFYWGAASVLGYPLIVDIKAAWTTVHALAPLAIPAGVGLALVYREGRAARATGDDVAAAAAAVLIVAAVGWAGAIAVSTSYANAQGPNNPLVQYAQPASEMQPALERVHRVARENDGVDVVFYGYYDDSIHRWVLHAPGGTAGPGDRGWFSRLPLPWYLERYGATVDSTNRSSDVTDSPPPVVVALGPEHGPNTSADLDAALTQTHDRYVYQQYQHSRALVIYVRDGAGETRNQSADQ
jgi:uncharacterized protein (TIGR03663 family)